MHVCDTIFTRKPTLGEPPYPRLMGDAMQGASGLFMREDIVDAEWRIVNNVFGDVSRLCHYKPGTWAPEEAMALIGVDEPWINPKPA